MGDVDRYFFLLHGRVHPLSTSHCPGPALELSRLGLIEHGVEGPDDALFVVGTWQGGSAQSALVECVPENFPGPAPLHQNVAAVTSLMRWEKRFLVVVKTHLVNVKPAGNIPVTFG